MEDLKLYEQVLLLSLHDEKGTAHAAYYGLAIGGAILAELALLDRIRLEPGKRESLVTIMDGPSTGDRLLDKFVKRIAASKRRLSPQMWIDNFSVIPDLVERIAQPLADRGILHRDKGRVLWIFRRTIYPTANPGPESRLVEEIRNGIQRDGPVEPRLAILIGIAHSAGVLEYVFARALLKERKQRLDEIVKMHAMGEATKKAVEASMAVIMAAVAGASS
jgi:Golgi phosphoprotein 3